MLPELLILIISLLSPRRTNSLEDNLKIKVDLITYGSIHPLLRERILNEEVKIIWKKEN